MDYPLKSDQLIYLYLSIFLPIDEICYKIIDYKNRLERKDTLDYHMDRWNNIAGSHYRLHDTHKNKISLIYNEKDYIVFADHRNDFYGLTGVSYQVVELIHSLIKIKNETNIFYDDDVYRCARSWQVYFEAGSKGALHVADKLYSLLANLIMKEMKSRDF